VYTPWFDCHEEAFEEKEVAGIELVRMHTNSQPSLGSRSLFPELTARAYLAHAAISPPSVLVTQAITHALQAYTTQGALAFGETVAQRTRLRELLARLMGAETGSVAIVPNTSTGVSHTALCLPWKQGDRVLLFGGEFPANVTPWQRAAALYNLELAWMDADLFRTDPTRAFETLDRELSRGLRMVALSQVQFQTGLRMPLKAIATRAHERGAEVAMDAIQGLGSVSLDVRAEGVDYLSSGSHKWLMGVEGCGVFYAHPEGAKRLQPHVAGWLSHEDPIRFLIEGKGHLRYDRSLRARADVVENGTFNALGCYALEASVIALTTLGTQAIYAHVNAYLDVLEEALTARGFVSLRAKDVSLRSCILAVLPSEAMKHSAPTLQRLLAERGVVTSVPDGVLRFAPHWPNHIDEIPAVLDAIDDALRSA
jgi:cysteine desulfurase / selenocysteine lyase